MWLEGCCGKGGWDPDSTVPQPPSQGITDWRCHGSVPEPFAAHPLCLKVRMLSPFPLLLLSRGKLWMKAFVTLLSPPRLSDSSFLFERVAQSLAEPEGYVTWSDDLLYFFKRRWWRQSSASFRPADWAQGLADLTKWCGIITSYTFFFFSSFLPHSFWSIAYDGIQNRNISVQFKNSPCPQLCIFYLYVYGFFKKCFLLVATCSLFLKMPQTWEWLECLGSRVNEQAVY